MTIRTVALSCLAVASASLAAVKVQPAEVSESRMVTLIKKENVFSSDSSRLEVKLNVQGPEVKGATKWGKVKFAEAKDDVGTDLKPKGSGFSFGPGADGLQDINRFGMDEKKKDSDAFDVEITLGLPARKATMIKSLKGEFHVLSGGEEKVVTLTKLKSMQGKPLEDPALKAAGINGKVAKASDDASLAIDYKGGTDAIKEVEIVDAAGKRVSSGRFSSGFGDQQTVNYMLDKPLDDAMTMKVTLVVGQKSVPVPFELKDVKLP